MSKSNNMANFFFILLITFFLFFFQFISCTKDQTKPKQVLDCAAINTLDNTWNLSVKNIMDNSCALPACHDASSAGQINLLSYSSAKTAFQTRAMLCAIKHEGGCITMPLGRPKLDDSLIAKIECWAGNNYPE
jgi:hypothetical protein